MSLVTSVSLLNKTLFQPKRKDRGTQDSEEYYRVNWEAKKKHVFEEFDGHIRCLK